MFGFKLWGNFAAFRDPLTITQNLTFPIPPKTTIGGILAAIIGIDYDNYFTDKDYFNFEYSIVPSNNIRRKSFAQNYLTDYTKRSETKHNAMVQYHLEYTKLKQLKAEKKELEEKEQIEKRRRNKLGKLPAQIERSEYQLNKKIKKLNDKLREKLKDPQPIFREMLISPYYYVFINNFKYENKIISYLKNHYREYSLYLGNTEFAANYLYLECQYRTAELTQLDSFTSKVEIIRFEPGKKYTRVYTATRTVANREYRDYLPLIICNKPIKLKRAIEGYIIETENHRFNCEFI